MIVRLLPEYLLSDYKRSQRKGKFLPFLHHLGSADSGERWSAQHEPKGNCTNDVGDG